MHSIFYFIFLMYIVIHFKLFSWPTNGLRFIVHGCRTPPTLTRKFCTALGSEKTKINNKPSFPPGAHSLVENTGSQNDNKEGTVTVEVCSESLGLRWVSPPF